MQWVERIFAAAMLAVCLVLLLRLVIGQRRRIRFDATLRRWGHRLGSLASGPTAQARAGREADKAIERARRAAAAGEWDGNVYRPRSFKRKKRDLH